MSTFLLNSCDALFIRPLHGSPFRSGRVIGVGCGCRRRCRHVRGCGGSTLATRKSASEQEDANGFHRRPLFRQHFSTKEFGHQVAIGSLPFSLRMPATESKWLDLHAPKASARGSCCNIPTLLWNQVTLIDPDQAAQSDQNAMAGKKMSMRHPSAMRWKPLRER